MSSKQADKMCVQVVFIHIANLARLIKKKFAMIIAIDNNVIIKFYILYNIPFH